MQDLQNIWKLEQHGKRTAIYLENGNKYSYEQLAEWQNHIGSYLYERKLVILVCQNTIGCLLCYLSFMRKGVVPLLLSPHLDAKTILHIAKLYHATYLCCGKNFMVTTRYKLLIDVEDYEIYEIYPNKGPQIFNELALLLTTSGSTGSSRCVRLSKTNIASNATAIGKYLKITFEDRAITSLPFHYTYGLSVIHSHLLYGASLLLTDKNILQKDFWKFADKYQATSFAGIPFTYETIEKFNLFERLPNSIRVLTQAGGKLTSRLQQKIATLSIEKEIRFYVMYGQTEATARISYLPYRLANEKIGSVGIAISGGRIWISEENEICYSGPNVCLGYAHNASDLKKDDENKGILYTGDLGYIENGFLYITGRKDREVKINGRRISLEHLEERWKEYSGRNMACVYLDTTLYLFVEGDYPYNTIKQIKKWVPLNSKNIDIRKIKKIPRKENGKVDYMCLKENVVYHKKSVF